MKAGPLAGYRVLVTRPLHHADELATAIERAGGEAVRFPVLKISGRSATDVRNDFRRLAKPGVVIFVSPNAAQYGYDAIRDAGATIAAVGPATRAAIEAAGGNVDIVPREGFNSEQLLAHAALQDVQNHNVMIVRGERGRELLAETLRKRGANVSYLPVYRREINHVVAEEVAALDRAWCSGQIDCVTVMSVETFENLLQQLPPTSVERLRETPLVAPGDRVIQTVLALLPGIPAIRAAGPGTADMLTALTKSRNSGQNQ